MALRSLEIPRVVRSLCVLSEAASLPSTDGVTQKEKHGKKGTEGVAVATSACDTDEAGSALRSMPSASAVIMEEAAVSLELGAHTASAAAAAAAASAVEFAALLRNEAESVFGATKEITKSISTISIKAVTDALSGSEERAESVASTNVDGTEDDYNEASGLGSYFSYGVDGIKRIFLSGSFNSDALDEPDELVVPANTAVAAEEEVRTPEPRSESVDERVLFVRESSSEGEPQNAKEILLERDNAEEADQQCLKNVDKVGDIGGPGVAAEEATPAVVAETPTLPSRGLVHKKPPEKHVVSRVHPPTPKASCGVSRSSTLPSATLERKGTDVRGAVVSRTHSTQVPSVKPKSGSKVFHKREVVKKQPSK